MPMYLCICMYAFVCICMYVCIRMHVSIFILDIYIAPLEETYSEACMYISIICKNYVFAYVYTQMYVCVGMCPFKTVCYIGQSVM